MAAAGSCPTCHDDEHTRNYDRSAHYKTWLAEATGKAPPGTGVSCATCHLPRRKNPSNGLTVVDHNQNSNLRPVDKMIRDVCVNCHGAKFSLDAMADPELIRQNFTGQPSKHIGTMDMVEKREAGRKK
jgi:formate-dependent nitrite reductase cytochrome c552 subunit